jgi:hypothetical protein
MPEGARRHEGAFANATNAPRTRAIMQALQSALNTSGFAALASGQAMAHSPDR